MARAKTSQLTPQAAAKARGSLSFRNTEQGVVMQKWPRARGRGVTPYRWYVEQEFLIASRWAADSSALDRDTAKNLTDGSLYIWRDAIVSAMYGNFIRILREDGTLIPTSREVAQNAQLILDQVTDEIGALLVRSEIGWVALMPGNVNDVLTQTAGLPTWQEQAAAGGGEVVTFPLAHLQPGSGTTQSASYVQGTMAVINPGDKPNAVQFFANAAAATSQNTPAIYGITTTAGGPLIIDGPTVTGVVAGLNTLPLNDVIDVSVPTFLYVGIHTKVASFSTPTAPGAPDWYLFASGALPASNVGLTQGSNTALAHCWLARIT